jgi:hypothetical protein
MEALWAAWTRIRKLSREVPENRFSQI